MCANFSLDDDTNDAACALTFLRIINDIHESPDHSGAVRYLNTVQERTNRKEYISFVGVLKEFQEEIVREIDAKKDYVSKCACTLFQGQTDLILGLGEYIPEILDELELEQHSQQQQEWRQEGGNQEWQQEPFKQTAPERAKQEWQQDPTTEAIASEWQQLQAEASLQWQQLQERGQEAMSIFMDKVRRRFLHSDQTACMKIHVTLQEFLVDRTMPVHKAKEEMAALLQRHNDLWKEFERFLPAELRAGPSEAGHANPP